MVDVKSRLESIPGYEPGKPAHRMDDVTFMDELEQMWGRRWGAQSSSGELRAALLARPGDRPKAEFLADPTFFINFGRPGEIPNFDVRNKQIEELAAALESEGVEVFWAEHPPEKKTGVYVSEVNIGLEPLIIRGGAVIHRAAVANKRGQERWISEILSGLGCPILFTVHGSAIHETRGNIVFLDPKHCVQATSVRSNMEGVLQVEPVLREAGVEEFHVATLPSYLNNMSPTTSAIGFHLCNILNMVDEKLAVVHSGALPYETLMYLKSKGIRLIDTSMEEAANRASNCTAIRPGVVLMARGNPVTTGALKREGVRVIELDFDDGGRPWTGPCCWVGPLIRDDGPFLDD